MREAKRAKWATNNIPWPTLPAVDSEEEMKPPEGIELAEEGYQLGSIFTL